MDSEPPQYLFPYLQSYQDPITIGWIVPLIIFSILIILTGLFSAGEVVFSTIAPEEIRKSSGLSVRSAKIALQLKDKPKKLAATLLMTNTLVRILLIIAADIMLKSLFGKETFDQLAVWLNVHIFFESLDTVILSSIISLLMSLLIISFVLVLFGETIPRIYATVNKVRIIQLTAWPLSVMNTILSPVSSLLVRWSSSIEDKLSETVGSGQPSKEDIDTAIELSMTGNSGASTQEVDILKGIVNFGDISAKQIMKPRIDVEGVDISMNFKEVMKIVKDSGYSRLPVYEEDLDHIKGILYVKDLLAYTHEDDNFQWQKLIRDVVYFIPESKKIDELLRDFQSRRLHMAVIVDEYGGTTGIATLEDIMEEVVGDIKDEFDTEEEVEFIKISDNNYIFEGKTLLNDVCRIIGENISIFDDDRGEADSIGGLILEMTGNIPSSEQEITIKHITLKVVSVTKRRIEKVSLIINE
ncbi:MAG: gliding motility-associated protein GldE [Saprospiraceae bacterium]|nr:MAG: gliding motility protein GldE [Bacteroidetes bacterium OLB9]MCO6464095.1 gliding motility-associated protein GldE [Saprospiraceae bacterium]